LKPFALFALSFCAYAGVARAEAQLPEVSEACQAEAHAFYEACNETLKDAEAFAACRSRNASLLTPACQAESRAHVVALAAACRADEAPAQFAAVCQSLKAHPLAFQN
jgi:hypothetical protein